MSNKTFFIILGIVYTTILLVCFYMGEERNRRFVEQGFKLCQVKNHEEWLVECPEERNLFQVGIDFFVGQ